MKVIYFILIFGLATCKTWSSVINLWYNYDYSLVKDYSSDYSEWKWFFRVAVNPGDTMDMEIKIPEGFLNYFSIAVYAFDRYTQPPSDYEIEHPNTSPINYDHSTASYYYEDGLIVYYYPYTAENSQYHYITYFSVHVGLSGWSNKFNYLIFRINLSKYLYSKINDLDFNQKYELDKSKFRKGVIPPNYHIYIRISVIEEDNMEVQLETHEAYDKSTAFTVNVCQYTYKPTEEQVYYPTYDSLCKDPLTNESKESEKYAYPFKTDKDTKYLSIRVINNLSNLDYLYILIYSEKGLAAAIIAVIVIVPLLVIGAIVFFVLKKCGCIGRS